MKSGYPILILSILLFIGCAQKLTVKSLEPAKVSDKAVKNVAVDDFKNDTISLKANIKSALSEVQFNNKPYFTVVNRDATDKILKEQKLQDSGLVNNKGEEEYFLSDISSIITGEILNKGYSYSIYTKQKTNYQKCVKYDKKKRCEEYAKYKVYCKKYFYSVNANISITKTKNSDIIFSKSFSKNSSQFRCEDENIQLYTKQYMYEKLAKTIAKEFVSYISPNYRYIQLPLIDKEDIKYNNQQSNMLKKALKLIDMKDIEGANQILQNLVKSTKRKSATALYNLALTYEYLEDLQKAALNYQMAKNITLLNDMNEDIIFSANRIKKVIDNQNKALRQIEQ